MFSCCHCSNENEEGSRFCDACGGALSGVCPACNAPNRPGARYCSQCRNPLAPPASQDGSPGPGTPPGPPSALKQVAAVLAPLDEGVRKHVTVLFADVRGATQLIAQLDPEAAMLQLDPAIEAMCQAVGQAGGVVNRIEGDGVMALFGAPMACEDHAIRACLAACDMLGRMARTHTDLAIRVGVASGDVVIRQTGRDASDWDAVGVTPHLARRLEQRAQAGSVLISGSTARLTRGFADLVPFGPIDVKGIAEPIETFQLQAITARPSWELHAASPALNRFVGREMELGQLAAAATRASFGRGRVVSVIGDAGVGKSRFVHEFLRSLPTGAWHVVRVAAVSHAVHAAYHLVAELLRAWIGAETTDDRTQVARKLAHTMALQGGGDAAPLQSLLDLPVDDPEWVGTELPVRRARALAAMRLAILREAAMQPLVLMVEDLHWADPLSVELLEAIVDGLGGARLLVIVTTRPVAASDGRSVRWSHRSYSSELHLSPLDAEDADVLLQALFGHDQALAPLRRQIVERAEGTPLFLEEIARAMIERGVIEWIRPRPRLPDADIEIPPSIQAVLAERIDRLPPDRRRLLQRAAVIGKDVPFALLARMADLPEHRLIEELAELQSAEFLYEVHLPSGVEYTFKHALTQVVAYEGMLRRHRRDLHVRALAAIEALYADRLDEMLERLAEHASKGELAAQTYAYALRAGRRASRRWAWREATAFLEQAIGALAQLPDTPDRVDRAIEVRLDLRVALAATGEFKRIGQCMAEARELAAAAGYELRVAQIDTSRCISASLLGELDEAAESGRHALAAAVRLDDPASFLNAVFALGQAHWYRGEIAEGERVLLQGLVHVRGDLRLKRSNTTGTASVLHLVCLSKTYALGGRFEAAIATAAEALEIAEETRRPYDLAYGRVGEGFHHYMLGDYDAAVVAFETGLAVSRSSGISLLVSSTARYLGHAYAKIGRRESAHDILREALEQSAAHGLIAFRTWCEVGLAHAHLPDLPAASAHFAGALDLARRHGYRPVEAHAACMLGLLSPCGSPDERAVAEQWFRQSLEVSEKLGLLPQAAAARAGLAAVWEGGTRPALADATACSPTA